MDDNDSDVPETVTDREWQRVKDAAAGGSVLRDWVAASKKWMFN